MFGDESHKMDLRQSAELFFIPQQNRTLKQPTLRLTVCLSCVNIVLWLVAIIMQVCLNNLCRLSGNRFHSKSIVSSSFCKFHRESYKIKEIIGEKFQD